MEAYWCVCVWNIWTDVKLIPNWYCHQDAGGGSESHSIHCPTKTVVWDCDIGTDHPDVPAKSFNFWLTSIILFNCTFWDSVPDGSLQWSSSFLGWFPWWLRHGAMDPFEGTLLGECGRTELWIYTFNIFFNLVIRLRKVKQSAIRFCTIFSRSCCPCHPWDTSANPPLLKWSCTEQPESCFHHKTGTVLTTWHSLSWSMEGLRLHAFRCGPLSLVRLNTLCTQFVWTWTAV